MSGNFDLPDDLNEDVDIVYFDEEDDEFLDNLEEDDVQFTFEEVAANTATEDDIEDVDPPEDKACLTFKDHTRSVFCGAFNSDNSLVVTGGEDDLAFVWDIKTGSIVLECTGHKDSVTCVGFSHDDKYVATGDMGGLIQVWDVKNKILVWCYEGDDLEWLVWHHSAYVLIGGVRTGEIYMWQIPQGNCKVLPTNGFKCTCGFLFPNGMQVAAGYEDGSMRIWDLKSRTIVAQHPSDNKTSVTNLKMSADGKLMIPCGTQMSVPILKTSDCKIVTYLQGENLDEIECAAFCEEADLPIVATGNLNGDLFLWDISRQTIRHKASIGYAITTLIWGSNAMLFVGVVDGVVYVYSGRNGQLLGSFTGHTSDILDVQLSKDSKWLLTTSDDNSAKIFDVQTCLSAQ